MRALEGGSTRSRRCSPSARATRPSWRPRRSGDAVFVFGGDGVVNEVLNGLPAGKPLGIVPGGHTNVLARALGVPRDPAEAVRERRISLGRVNGRRFSFAAGIGVDSETVRELETMKRAGDGKRRGDLAYARVAVRRLLAALPARFEIERRRPGGDALRLERLGVHVRRAEVVSLLARGATSSSASTSSPRNGACDDRVSYLRPRRLRPGNRRSPRRPARPRRRPAFAWSATSRCRSQADGEDLGDVTEAVFEAERDAVSVLGR